MNNGTADVSKYTLSVPFYKDDSLGLDGRGGLLKMSRDSLVTHQLGCALTSGILV